MFSMLSNLTKAVVGAVVALPVAVVADTITLGGILTDRDVPYTVDATSQIVSNIEKATK